MKQTYGFTCGYCETKLDTPHRGADKAARFAQREGWRMTYGPSKRWGDGAHNTCPNCLLIGADPSTVIPMHWQP